MDATTLLVTMYCLVDEWLGDRRLRPHGPQPILADSEVLTIECVGEFLGIDTDKGLYEHFRRTTTTGSPPWPYPRPTLRPPAANLRAIKAQLRQQLLGQVGLRPGHLGPGQFPNAGLPLRSRLSLPAAGGAGKLRP